MINLIAGMFMALVTLILLSLTSFAKAYEVPKDAVIKVYDASGKQIGEMSRSNYKVVKIGSSAPPVKIVEKNTCSAPTAPSAVKNTDKKNAIIIHVGEGPRGVKSSHEPGIEYKVQPQRHGVHGLTYCRDIEDDEAAICGSIQSNDTYQLGVKLGF